MPRLRHPKRANRRSGPMKLITAPHAGARPPRFACALALVALALIVWSLLDPRPIRDLAMSLAQGLGPSRSRAFLFVRRSRSAHYAAQGR